MPNKTQTEATLADLAIGIVSEKLPELLNFLVGFELVTANDDRTKAAGILGFRIGEELVYMPILFLGGKIKGNEILYLKGSDVFTSASKPWVDYLTSRSPGAMGRGQNKATLPQPTASDMQIFHRVPIPAKVASYQGEVIPPTTMEASPVPTAPAVSPAVSPTPIRPVAPTPAPSSASLGSGQSGIGSSGGGSMSSGGQSPSPKMAELFEGASNHLWELIENSDFEEVSKLKRAEFSGVKVLQSFGPRGQLQFMEMLANEFPEVVQKLAAAGDINDWVQIEQFPEFESIKTASMGQEIGVRALGLDCGFRVSPASASIAGDRTLEGPAKVAFLTAGGWLRKCAYRGELPIVANLTPGADMFPVDVMAKIADLNESQQTALERGLGSLEGDKFELNGVSDYARDRMRGGLGQELMDGMVAGNATMSPEGNGLVAGAPEPPAPAGSPSLDPSMNLASGPSWWDQNSGNVMKGLGVGAGALGAYGLYRAYKNRKTVPKMAELALVTAESVLDGSVLGLDMAQKTAALSDGFIIIDRRPRYGMSKEGAEVKYVTDHETCEVDPIERFKVRLDTPRESGFYEILNAAGKMQRVFLAINPFMIEKPTFGHPSQVVVDPESGRFHKVTYGENVFATGRLAIEESKWKDSYGSMPSVKSMKVGKTYMLIDGDSRASAPFDVINKSGSGSQIDFVVKSLWSFSYSCESGISSIGARALKVVDTDKFSNITMVGDFVFVPSDWKVIEVDDTYADSDSAKKTEREITPGSSGTATAAMITGDMFKLRLEKEPGGEKVKIVAGSAQADEVDRKIAAIILTSKLRMPAEAAMEALREAFTKGASERCIRGCNRIGLSIPKVADDLTIPVDQIGTGQPLVTERGMTGSHPSGFEEQEPHTDRQTLDLNNLSDPSQDWRDNDQANWDRIKPQENELLERALQSGHNPVFDSAMIGVLLRSSRSSAQVAQWLPDLVSSLDTKCRLLLLFYWHNDDFAQDYGKDELAEFEDTLLDSIKRDGQLVLFLKQKSGESASVKIDALAEE